MSENYFTCQKYFYLSKNALYNDMLLRVKDKLIREDILFMSMI